MAEREFLTVIPSHRRPHAVEESPVVQELGGDVLWVVNDDTDRRDYRAAGARSLVVAGPTLADNRNRAISEALSAGRVLLMVDDDVRAVYRAWHDSARLEHCTPTPILDVAADIWHYMQLSGSPLGGVQAARNPYYCRQRVHVWAYVIGALHVIDPTMLHRFSWPVREDFEIVCKVLRDVGHIVRMDCYCLDTEYWTNAGGLQEFRTPERELRYARLAVAKYPDLLRIHPKRHDDTQLRHTVATMPELARSVYLHLNAEFAARN